MLWFAWFGMIVLEEHFVDIALHGKVARALVIIPVDVDSTEQGSVPVHCNLVVLFKTFFEVDDMVARCGFDAEVVDEKVAIVREAAGARFNDIEMNVRAFLVSITDDAKQAASGIASMLGVEQQMVEESPFALVGPTSKLIEDLLERRERWGFSYVIVGADDVDSFAPVVAALNGK